MELIEPGLCGSCRWSEPVVSSRGAAFLRCGLHGRRPGFERYPRLPVLHCPGYERRGPAPATTVHRSNGEDQDA